MTGHSPVPWQTEATSLDPSGLYVTDQVGNSITGVPIDAANAAHIVRCVNAHEALVAALQQALETIKIWHGMPAVFEPQQKQDHLWELYRNSPEIKRIEAALALSGVTR